MNFMQMLKLQPSCLQQMQAKKPYQLEEMLLRVVSYNDKNGWMKRNYTNMYNELSFNTSQL